MRINKEAKNSNVDHSTLAKTASISSLSDNSSNSKAPRSAVHPKPSLPKNKFIIYRRLLSNCSKLTHCRNGVQKENDYDEEKRASRFNQEGSITNRILKNKKAESSIDTKQKKEAFVVCHVVNCLFICMEMQWDKLNKPST